MHGFRAADLIKFPGDATQSFYAIREGQLPYFIQQVPCLSGHPNFQISQSPSHNATPKAPAGPLNSSQAQPSEGQQRRSTPVGESGATIHPPYTNQVLTRSENGPPNYYAREQFICCPFPNFHVLQHQIHPGQPVPFDVGPPPRAEQESSSRKQNETVSPMVPKGQSQPNGKVLFPTANVHPANVHRIPPYVDGHEQFRGPLSVPLTIQTPITLSSMPPGLLLVPPCEKAPRLVGECCGGDEARKQKKPRKKRQLLSAQKLLFNAQKMLSEACQKIMAIQRHESQSYVPSCPPPCHILKTSRRKAASPCVTQPPWDSNPKIDCRKATLKSDRAMMEIQAVLAQCVEQIMCEQLKGGRGRSLQKLGHLGSPLSLNDCYQACVPSHCHESQNASENVPKPAKARQASTENEFKDPASPASSGNDSEEVRRLLQEIECVCNDLCTSGCDGKASRECLNVCKLMQLLSARSPSPPPSPGRYSGTPPSADDPCQAMPVANNCCANNQQAATDNMTLEIMKLLMNTITPPLNPPRQRKRSSGLASVNQAECRSRGVADGSRTAYPSKGIPRCMTTRRACSKTNNCMRGILRQKSFGTPCSNMGRDMATDSYSKC